MKQSNRQNVPIFLLLSFNVGGLSDNVECNELKKLLLQLEDELQLVVKDHYVDSAASLGEILDRYHHDSIAFIHIIGHGDVRTIQMRNASGDFEPLGADQFSKMLRLRKIHPRLVYFNACQSKTMLSSMKRAGIAAIGYETDVEDLYAINVAKMFYHHCLRTSTRLSRSIADALEYSIVENESYLSDGFESPFISASKEQKSVMLFDFNDQLTVRTDLDGHFSRISSELKSTRLSHILTPP